MYVEDLLALNFMMNTILLFLTAKLAGRTANHFRILAGGLFASLYCLVIFLPQGRIATSWMVKLLMSLFIVALTFRPQRVVELLRLCGAFFLASFFLAGAIFSVHFFSSTPVVIQGGVFYISPPRPGVFFAGILVTFLLLGFIWQFGEKQRQRTTLRYSLLLRAGGQEVRIMSLVDTGNSLRDPLSGKALCIAGSGAVLPLLPVELRTAYTRGEDPVEALGGLNETLVGNVGVVPYRSLENAGMLVTFRLDEMALKEGTRLHILQDIPVAITSRALSLDGDVEFLLHPEILEALRRSSFEETKTV